MYVKLTDKQIDLADSYQRWQMEKYGRVLVDRAPAEVYENRSEEMEQSAQWVEKTAEVEMIKEQSNH